MARWVPRGTAGVAARSDHRSVSTLRRSVGGGHVRWHRVDRRRPFLVGTRRGWIASWRAFSTRHLRLADRLADGQAGRDARSTTHVTGNSLDRTRGSKRAVSLQFPQEVQATLRAPSARSYRSRGPRRPHHSQWAR
jgi:hypothetical protein